MGTIELILVVAIVALAAVFVAWRMWRVATKRERACPNCPGSCAAAERMDDSVEEQTAGAEAHKAVGADE